MKVVAASVSPTQRPILVTGFVRVACVEFGRHIELGVTFRRCVSSKPAHPVGPTGVAREHVIVMGGMGAVDHVVSWSCTVASSTVSIAAPSVSPDASLRATRSRDRLLHAAQRHRQARRQDIGAQYAGLSAGSALPSGERRLARPAYAVGAVGEPEAATDLKHAI